VLGSLAVLAAAGLAAQPDAAVEQFVDLVKTLAARVQALAQ